jgi:Afadin- and alpha -actinin-Binding
MDPGSLQNASTYLNNLLLARGLLRNGKSIEFASVKKGNAGSEHTMAKIINLVHDLVIRRDRDADQRESLATNIRNLRMEEAQRLSELERSQAKNAELVRNLALAEGHKRSLEASAHKAEASARELKEQMAKMKSTLDQVRAKCVNDIRKRDIELEKLKKHVAGMQRGATQSSGMKIIQMNPQPALPKNAREFRSGLSLDDENWSLEKETNDFLAALVNETSTENVALRHLISATVDTLKELTGLDQPLEQPPIDPEVGIPVQYKQSRANTQATQPEALVSCEALSEQMDGALGHCRAILKDPSFVSIEEVQIREDEIIKLREGWEKMASRWKDAVAMMDTWRKRMMEGGNTVDLEELRGLGFDKSMAAMPDAEAPVDADESLTEMFDDESEAANEEMDESIDQESYDIEQKASLEMASPPPAKRLASSPARRGVRLPRPVTALDEIEGNAQRKKSHSDRSTLTISSADSGIGSLDGSVELDPPSQKSPIKTPSKVGQMDKCHLNYADCHCR